MRSTPIAAVFALITLLSACGSGDTTTPPEEVAAPASSAPAKPAAPKIYD